MERTPALHESTVASCPEPRAHRHVSPFLAFELRFPTGSLRLHPGLSRRAPQHARARPSSVSFVPRTTPRRAAVPCTERRTSPHVPVNRPSHRDVFVQVDSHARHGRAHPSAQGQGFTFEPPSLLIISGDGQRHRVSVPNPAHRAVVSVSRPLCRACLFLAGARARGGSQAERTLALGPSCDLRRDAAHEVVGRAKPHAACCACMSLCACVRTVELRPNLALTRANPGPLFVSTSPSPLGACQRRRAMRSRGAW
jgi:hypothetical protein